MARKARRSSNAVTIRAVAERAGVSVMTVSNVVNGSGRASAATIAAVRRAIDELGYLPNMAARGLASSGATTIGLAYVDKRTPFLDAILVGALKAATASGLQLIVRDVPGEARDQAEEVVRGLTRSGADALLLVPPIADILTGTGFLAGLGVPCAVILTGGPLRDAMTVRIDNRAAMRTLTELLIAAGHRRIGFVTGPVNHSDGVERLLGYRDALRARAIPDRAELTVPGFFTFESGLAAGRVLLDLADRPTAIVASNDEMAAGIIAEAHRRRIHLPAQLAVTGFDDSLIAARIWPSLTVVRQPIAEIAYRATERLIAALRAPTADGTLTDDVLGHEIIERESTAMLCDSCVPAGDTSAEEGSRPDSARRGNGVRTSAGS
jgi:LacI family transcriptional regulator